MLAPRIARWVEVRGRLGENAITERRRALTEPSPHLHPTPASAGVPAASSLSSCRLRELRGFVLNPLSSRTARAFDPFRSAFTGSTSMARWPWTALCSRSSYLKSRAANSFRLRRQAATRATSGRIEHDVFYARTVERRVELHCRIWHFAPSPVPDPIQKGARAC